MIKTVSVDTTQTEPLLRVLDTVVIKLEGGTDDDLRILDEKPKDISYPERVFEKKIDPDDDVIITSVEKKCDDEPKCVSPKTITRRKSASDEENWDDEDDTEVVVKPIEPEKMEEKKKKSLKRKRTSSDSSSSSSSARNLSSSSSSSEDEDDEKLKSKYDLETIKKEDEEMVEKKEDKSDDSLEQHEEKDQVGEEKPSKAESVTLEDAKENGDEENAENNKNTTEEEHKLLDNKKADILKGHDHKNENKMETQEIEHQQQKPEKNKDNKTSAMDDEQPETIDLDKVKDGPQPRALHRTSSIFLRNLAPSITKSEIEAVCQKFDGYLRVAIADPLVERRWYRRGWVTFKRDVNIKEICWNLNNTRLRDCEMGAIVNRDLSRRVRPVNGMTAHKTIVRADIKLCAKIAINLDEKFKLWVSLFCQRKHFNETTTKTIFTAVQ